MMHVVPRTSSFNQRITKYDRESKRMGKGGGDGTKVSQSDSRKQTKIKQSDLFCPGNIF
jgi:hypothetical protein